MEQVVIIVEAVRCFQCQRLLHPQEAFYQRQMMTAVEVGSRTGHTHRYEMVNVCTKCQSVLAGIEAEERQRAWWRWFWVGAFLVNCVLMAALPVGVFPLYGAIACRVVWKWRAKRQQKIELGQANRGEVLRTAAENDAATELTKGGSSRRGVYLSRI